MRFSSFMAGHLGRSLSPKRLTFQLRIPGVKGAEQSLTLRSRFPGCRRKQAASPIQLCAAFCCNCSEAITRRAAHPLGLRPACLGLSVTASDHDYTKADSDDKGERNGPRTAGRAREAWASWIFRRWPLHSQFRVRANIRNKMTSRDSTVNAWTAHIQDSAAIGRIPLWQIGHLSGSLSNVHVVPPS
jgi:hypothetical protein